MKRRPVAILLTLLGLAAVTLAVTPWIGMQRLPLAVLLHPADSGLEAVVFWKVRAPRVLAAFLAGAALAVSGMAFQAMFRNPLATPFTLGVSSGASLGAVLAIRFGFAGSLFGLAGTSLGAFAGAILSILGVYTITRHRGEFSTFRLLLAGVAINFFFSSLILCVQYTSSLHDSFRVVRWMMGGLDLLGFRTVLELLPFALGGLAVLGLLVHELNLLATGDDLAASRGVSVGLVRHLLFVATSLMVGGVVAICGPIGFVGLMVPHMCRLLVGSNHVFLMPASVLLGGSFLTICDTAARTVAAPADVPVGILTSLLGGPFFLWLLLGRATRGQELGG